MRKSNRGFTLIELVMVIVIMGVLAAFAIPRFANFSGQARGAAINSVAGAMKSAAAISHAQWLISSGDPTLLSVSLDGTSIVLEDGYPTVVGIIEAIGGTDSVAQLTVDTTAPIARVEPGNVAGEITYGYSATCQVTYREAHLTAATPVTHKITVVDGTC